jgi:dihydroorotase
LPLLIHGEVVDESVDVFDREKVFIERHLGPLSARFGALKIVFEHITTEEAVEFVTEASANVAATITVHHLLINRNALFAGGLRAHHYCLPVVKRERHRLALLRAATGGNPKFFLGTDSAPHARAAKENGCGCAGIYTAHSAMELYAEAFAGIGALDKLEQFAAFNGADFYGLARSLETITLHRRPWTVPMELAFPGQTLVPFRAGEVLAWTLDPSRGP